MATKKVILKEIVDGAAGDSIYPKTSIDQVEELESALRAAGSVSTISVNNGTPLEPDSNKNINITVPEDLADLNEDSTHQIVTAAQKTEWSNKGTYSKPSGGIPSTDLSSAVQTSLGKADTALQNHQDVSGKEDKSNKVTSFSSPTDTQYPSAKLVNDQLTTKQNTISDLATIRSGASAGATAYQKPGTGIPKTDLASAVQTSLGKADTALQSHQDISGKANSADVYTKAQVDDMFDDVAHWGDTVGNVTTADFNAQTDTVWNKAQVLSAAQQAQARTNINAQEALVSGTSIKTINNISLLGSGNITISGGGGGGVSVQADWAQTDSNAEDYIKNKPDIGATYTAAWTASSSAAPNAALTADLTLPKGVYLVRVGFPALNKALAAANLAVGGAATRDTNIYYSGSTYFSGFEIVTVGDNGGTVHLQTMSSTSVTYTYLERGGLIAVKFV